MHGEQPATTILGSDITIEAKVIRFSGDVHVYGTIVGDVESDSSLVLAESGSILGNVRADQAQVAGKLVGDVVCSRFDIKHTGSVEGVIRADKWSMDQGAVIEAEFIHADRAELTRDVARNEAAYRAALQLASDVSGKSYGPSDAYQRWARRLQGKSQPEGDASGGRSAGESNEAGTSAHRSPEDDAEANRTVSETTELDETGGSIPADQRSNLDGDKPSNASPRSAAGAKERFADAGTVGRAAWSKSIDPQITVDKQRTPDARHVVDPARSEDAQPDASKVDGPTAKRIWPSSEDSASSSRAGQSGDLFGDTRRSEGS